MICRSGVPLLGTAGTAHHPASTFTKHALAPPNSWNSRYFAPIRAIFPEFPLFSLRGMCRMW